MEVKAESWECSVYEGMEAEGKRMGGEKVNLNLASVKIP